jgi:hypothetical protein
MGVNETVNDFLRDAQYRVAELTIEMDELDDAGNYLYVEKEVLRHELLSWMDTIYWGRHNLVDGSTEQTPPDSSPYNFTASGVSWTDNEIIQECHLLRNKANMNPVPFINWNNYNPELVSYGGSPTTGNESTGAAFPIGTLGQYLTYNISGQVVAQSWPIYAGALESEDIFDYFLDRA